MDLPHYSLDRIQSVASLSRALGLSESKLRREARRAPSQYIGPIPKPKKNSGIRYVYDTKPPLKNLLKRINQVFLKKVHYPNYLTGSLPNKNYVSHVALHASAHYAITEDIKGFFDFVSAHHVYRVWHHFFGFSEAVAILLTQLTTKDGHIYQGAPTSSYLANLVFWDRESALVNTLVSRCIRYSRYVDDITLTSTNPFGADDRSWAIAKVYGMIGATGFKPRRDKHQSMTSAEPIIIMGLNANGKSGPTIPQKEQANIRAMVFQLEKRAAQEGANPELIGDLNRTAAKVGKLKRLHPKNWAALRARLDKIRVAIKGFEVN